ncbi:MAG: hypothetical protein R3268_00515 [Acidiferrobacterales bacterium]|nr:hypothetical protein [Acidiferrobacterales bacterium]
MNLRYFKALKAESHAMSHRTVKIFDADGFGTRLSASTRRGGAATLAMSINGLCLLEDV